MSPPAYPPSSQPNLSTSDLSSADDVALEKASFLPSSTSSRVCACSHTSSHRRTLPVLLLHLSFLCIYSIIALGMWKGLRLGQAVCEISETTELVHSPAREAAMYRPKTFEGGDPDGPFVGNPGPDVDHAWRHLLSRSNVRVSQETLTKINRTSIELADGSGDHWGSIGVYHHLHCLKTLRHYIARDLYGDEMFQNFTIAPGHVYPTHIEHCIESLRHYLMCQPDLTVVTYDWVPYLTEPEPNLAIRHDCIDWERFEGWADMHAFSMRDSRGLVRRPNGTVWPEP